MPLLATGGIVEGLGLGLARRAARKLVPVVLTLGSGPSGTWASKFAKLGPRGQTWASKFAKLGPRGQTYTSKFAKLRPRGQTWASKFAKLGPQGQTWASKFWASRPNLDLQVWRTSKFGAQNLGLLGLSLSSLGPPSLQNLGLGAKLGPLQVCRGLQVCKTWASGPNLHLQVCKTSASGPNLGLQVCKTWASGPKPKRFAVVILNSHFFEL